MLEVGVADEEAVGAESGSIERAYVELPLAPVAQARHPDTAGGEQLDEPADTGGTAHRDDAHAFGVEVASAPHGEVLKSGDIADALDEHDRTS
ncbi:hypothetical protein GCM10022234_11300 [Aeromicrobium panaciterrae]